MDTNDQRPSWTCRTSTKQWSNCGQTVVTCGHRRLKFIQGIELSDNCRSRIIATRIRNNRNQQYLLKAILLNVLTTGSLTTTRLPCCSVTVTVKSTTHYRLPPINTHVHAADSPRGARNGVHQPTESVNAGVAHHAHGASPE
jgi:hypothetical protein